MDQDETQVVDAGEIVDNQDEELPQKKKRKRKDRIFETCKKTRNKLDKSKINSLDQMLKKWYERTNTPTVALTLTKSSEGQLIVKYSGPSEFSAFAEDPKIRRKFSKIVAEGMKKSAVQQSAAERDTRNTSHGDIDETIIRILLEDDVSKFSMDDKRKLISQIITGSDMRRRGKWNLECKPEWWPEEIDFRSPSLRNPAMKIDEVDWVINNCVNFVQALYAEVSSDNGGGDDANEQIPDVDVVNNDGVNNDGVDNDGVNIDVDNGEGEGVVADVNVSGDAVSDRGDEESVFQGEACRNRRKRKRGNGKSRRSDVNEGLGGKIDETECLCMFGKECAAGAVCCELFVDGNQRSSCVVCSLCQNHFHRYCVPEFADSAVADWYCGCTLKFEDLRSLQKFKDLELVSRMFHFHNNEMTKFLKGILSKKIPSNRYHLMDEKRSGSVPKEFYNFDWVIDDGSGSESNNYLKSVFYENVARVGNSLPCVRKLPIHKRHQMCRYCLAPEILAFLLHKEEGASIIFCRRIILEDHVSASKQP